jgi:hypothetical protein
MPHLLVAIAIATLRPRWLAVAAGAALAVANLLVVNQYVAQFERNGSYRLFTDALWPLSKTLAGWEGHTIYTLDFGMDDNLTLLHQGRLDMRRAWSIDSKTYRELETMASNAGALFLNHVPSLQYLKGADERLEAVARARGYARRDLLTIEDSCGRPQFELFRFERYR